jgi:hypothetical protein
MTQKKPPIFSAVSLIAGRNLGVSHPRLSNSIVAGLKSCRMKKSGGANAPPLFYYQ